MKLQKNCNAYIVFMTIITINISMANICLAWDIILDADTPATGSLLCTQPLLTTFGEIQFSGQIRDRDGDDEFNNPGAMGNVFDIDSDHNAYLIFDFDIKSLTFIYGGNTGSILLQARDDSGLVVDSFFKLIH